jgi:hypothetical protein
MSTRATLALCVGTLSAGLVAIADADSSTPPATSGSAAVLVATLERTGCYGTCPSYKVSVYSDGRVEYDGETYVKEKGHRTAELSAADLAALHEAFARAKYLDLENKYDCHEWTDNPSAFTSYRKGGRTKALRHYYGCRSPAGVQGLTDLESRFDELVHSDRWIGKGNERR